MKLLEKVIYGTILFLAVYTLLSITLRAFAWTSIYVSH